MTEPRPTARRGCLFYGCIVVVVLLLIALAGALAGIRYAKKMFNEFTAATPAALPAVKLEPAEIEQVRRRVDDFRQAVRAGKATAPLVLTADEINALIATDADAKPMKGKLYVSLEGDQITGQVSVPMEEAGLPVFRGRYLNGAGSFNLSLREGTLRLMVQTVSVNGKPIPELYLQKIRGQNLAQNINSDPRASAALSRLQSIEVKDSKLVIVPRPAP